MQQGLEGRHKFLQLRRGGIGRQKEDRLLVQVCCSPYTRYPLLGFLDDGTAVFFRQEDDKEPRFVPGRRPLLLQPIDLNLQLIVSQRVHIGILAEREKVDHHRGNKALVFRDPKRGEKPIREGRGAGSQRGDWRVENEVWSMATTIVGASIWTGRGRYRGRIGFARGESVGLSRR